VSEARTFRTRPRRRSGGFTLVELLVAVVLGLFLLGGVVSIFVNSRQSFRVNENMARVQENVRFTFDTLMRDIREAGNVPCGTRFMANVTSTAPSWWADWATGTLVGYDNTQAGPKAFGTTTGLRISGTDAITVLRPVSDESAIQPISAHTVASNKFTVATGSAYAKGDVVTLCDSQSAVLLKVDDVTTNDLAYGVTNCGTKLGYPTGACNTATPAKTFAAGAIAAKMDPAHWYIGANATGGKSLFRLQLTKTSAGLPTDIAQEMVSNVTDMQVDFLMRDPAGTLGTTWIPASDDTFTLGGAGGFTTTNSFQVVAVRLTLTFVTDEKVGTDGNAVQRKYRAVSSLRARDVP
jgi:type IV pilus assembly protein PilW